MTEGASTAKAAAAALALGVTASGCVYLLYRSSSSSSSREHAAGDSEQPELQPVKITTLGQLQQYSGLRGRLNAALASVFTPPHVVSAVVPNQGAALPAFPQYLCSLTTLTQVNLSGAAIAELPPQIGALRHLKDLDLGRNQLARLPDEIGQLTALKFLNLMCNQLEELPDSIGNCTSLYRLGLKSNRLRSLPASIGQLSGLVELFITDNCLETLPAEMGKLTALVKCQASFNESLTSLPPEMGSLPNLELLRLACCNLKALPPSFAGLRKLAWVSLASNPLAGAKHPSVSSAHLPVVTLGEMQMGRKLGEGASGEVFAATWKGRDVAVKIFQAEKSPDGHSRDEMAIAVALHHKHLIRMLGVLEEPLGLVMDLVAGRPQAQKPNFESLLRCRWPPGATFPMSYVLRYALGLAEALEEMHYRGVAHGDVYAHNVLADEEGNVFLCDYGASFFYSRKNGVPFEGQEVRAYGLLLNDLVQRLDVPFQGMEAVLSAQKQLVFLVQKCVGGEAAKRPCFGAVARQLRTVLKWFDKASKGQKVTPLSTPVSTPRVTPSSTPMGTPRASLFGGNPFATPRSIPISATPRR